ncbi:TOTE conflict system archaeo-eukaryotic primase domain-containing protein [Leadbettera azotonutricia]|uniref:Putative dead/deah box helicase n=1 Tax=Leadbettera azotonutricia (strain ATCC BAA-888 / DSM 13862 / ZAS-9) TaxID=545695 RepID=F5YCX2_LEAAZ|nr:DEAD/DEAH box helicase [Leadbettera azotonutricia]AEF80282.1 putative dead/deah box helicase [Leadbettera azotonutricia ZAS-9]
MDEAASIETLVAEIADLESLLLQKKAELVQLKTEPHAIATEPVKVESPVESLILQNPTEDASSPGINNHSAPEDKITLFRSLFRGREDIYAKRFESKKTGKSGYQPVCKNEWVREVCEKAQVACGVCPHRSFEPVTDEVIRNHLAGFIPSRTDWGKPSPFVMGIYPLLQNETCHLLAVDFDKQSWQEDVKAFFETCQTEGIPASVERSRSGNGAHIWIFFDHPIPASKARKLGSLLMTRTLDRRPEIGLDSFDRFFPNQDTLPKGGFGNLIALPLQKAARVKNHSVFLDPDMVPYLDQWQYLASIKRIDEETIDAIIQTALERNELLPVSFNPLEIDSEDKPWQRKPGSLQFPYTLPAIMDPLPSVIDVIISDQIYINHTGLPPILRNRILRLASFSNPEFYRAQAMRLPTWNKPRILYCYEFFPEYIGLPIGCLSELTKIFDFYHITPQFQDKQNHGTPINVSFQGELYAEQKAAADAMAINPTGILSASTAFGKTVIALWLIVHRKVNTLILVHRKQLLDQWVERIQQFLNIPKTEIGCFSGAKKKRTGIIDIAVMQSISKKGNVADWVKDYGQIIVDECHHISASSFESIIRKCPAYYRLGLSATVTRKDGQQPIVIMNLGDIRYSVRQSNTQFIQKVIPHYTEFQLPATEDKPLEIQDIFRHLWMDENRNRQIIQDIVAAFTEGREILVLSERIDHLALLEEALLRFTDYLFVLKGGLGKKQLKTIMENIQNEPSDAHRIILATGKYLGEGFDLPCLDTLFLVFPFSWKGTLIQYAGRLNRTYYGKTETRIYDYVDEKVPVLLRMYNKRVNGYKSLGFNIFD